MTSPYILMQRCSIETDVGSQRQDRVQAGLFADRAVKRGDGRDGQWRRSGRKGYSQHTSATSSGGWQPALTHKADVLGQQARVELRLVAAAAAVEQEDQGQVRPTPVDQLVHREDKVSHVSVRDTSNTFHLPRS